jgi:acyl-CoA synthetase (AMP-forming)/AMP-acid ligase II
MAMKTGATLVLEKSFAFPQAIFNRMREENVTGLPLVPTMAALILQMKDLQPGAFPHLRYLTNTAAALPPGARYDDRAARPRTDDRPARDRQEHPARLRRARRSGNAAQPLSR